MFSNENESCFFCVEVNKIKKKSLKYTALHFKVFQCFWNQSALHFKVFQCFWNQSFLSKDIIFHK